MPANIVDAGIDNFETVLKAAEGQGPGLLLILFLGDLVASTGESWCPDCARAEPVIYEQVNGSEKPVTVVRVYVGDKATWRRSEHPLRNDERFRVRGVPTLIRWENGAIAGRLEDNEADDQGKIRRLLKTRTGRSRSRSSSLSSSGSQSASSSPSPRSKSKSSSYSSKRTAS